MIYPTLDYLQDQAFITITEEENMCALSMRQDSGGWKPRNSLADSGAYQSPRSCFPATQKPGDEAGIDNFKAVLDLKSESGSAQRRAA